jgi:hypothetical protein
VIEDSDVDEAEGFLQALRDELVGLGRFGDADRVRVGVLCLGLFCVVTDRRR